jgi:hypothetical protein
MATFPAQEIGATEFGILLARNAPVHAGAFYMGSPTAAKLGRVAPRENGRLTRSSGIYAILKLGEAVWATMKGDA